MKTNTAAALLLSTIFGAAILYGSWRWSNSVEESPTPSQNVASQPAPLDAPAGSPGIATPKELRPNPLPERSSTSASAALAEMERRLANSAAAGGEQTSDLRNNDRSIRRPDKLEKEDNVRVGVVFSVGENGLEVEGKGAKKLLRKIFDDDEEGED